MASRLPKANTQFAKLTSANLGTFAQAVHDGLLAAVATYPTPPIMPAALQTSITTYNTAYAASIGGSKEQRAAFHTARFNLRNALRVDATYVNSVTWGLIQTGTDYPTAKGLILSTGYALSVDPAPVGVLPVCSATTWGSFQSGTFTARLVRIPGAKAYSVIVGDQNTGKTYTLTFTTSRILITDLIPGHQYVFSFAAIGANPTVTYGFQITQYVI